MSTLDLKIPGVYLNQIVPTPEPELLTGVPIFLGLAEAKAEADKNTPKKLTLEAQFKRYFDSVPESKGYLRDAVKGFFTNGGGLCYVIALTDNTHDVLTLDVLKKALETSEVLENVDLVCVPDIMLASETEIIPMQQAVLEHCDRIGDRFAILDALPINNDAEIDQLNQQRQELKSKNGALYAPWLIIENRKEDDPIPPCGHIAGIYASSDRIVGVHGAPANISLEGVLDLSLALTPAQQKQLNPKNESGINCIRSFRGRGIRVWGVRTLSSLAAWQYVNVCRLFLTFGRWANQNLAETVFEPNAPPLWIRIQRDLSVYCESLWRQGALQGAVAQEAFYVKCDKETNPRENREMGRLVAEVGLAPAIPGEFIQLLLVQSSSGISVT